MASAQFQSQLLGASWLTRTPTLTQTRTRTRTPSLDLTQPHS